MHCSLLEEPAVKVGQAHAHGQARREGVRNVEPEEVVAGLSQHQHLAVRFRVLEDEVFYGGLLDSSAEVEDVSLEGLGIDGLPVPEDHYFITVWVLLVENVKPDLHLGNCACQLPIHQSFSQDEHLKLSRFGVLFLTLEAYGGLYRACLVELPFLVRTDTSVEHVIGAA